MILYRCFVCGTGMESPSCLIGKTEKCPDCGFSNWVPYHNTERAEGTQPWDQEAADWSSNGGRLRTQILSIVHAGLRRALPSTGQRRKRGNHPTGSLLKKLGRHGSARCPVE